MAAGERKRAKQTNKKETQVLQYFAVMGNPIEHSLSPFIHHYFAKQTHMHLIYEKIKVEEQGFKQQVSDFFSQNGKGLNITLPFKQQAYAMAEQTTPRCKRAGAANTLWMENHQLHADNTDGIGLIRDLNRYFDLQGARILILGAGGAARGIIAPLLEHHLADLAITNRTLATAMQLQNDFPGLRCIKATELIGEFDLIINATSASLAGELAIVPKDCLTTRPFCYDLAYNQKDSTPFVQYAQAADCIAVDGLGMLIEQAAEAFFIWHGVRPETDELLNLLRK